MIDLKKKTYCRLYLSQLIVFFHAADLLSWKRFPQSGRGSSKAKLKLLLVSDINQTPVLLSAIALRFRGEYDSG